MEETLIEKIAGDHSGTEQKNPPGLTEPVMKHSVEQGNPIIRSLRPVSSKKIRLVIRNRGSKRLSILLTTRGGKVIDRSSLKRRKVFSLPQGDYRLEAWLERAHICLCRHSGCATSTDKVSNHDYSQFRALAIRISLSKRKQYLCFREETTIGDIISGIH